MSVWSFIYYRKIKIGVANTTLSTPLTSSLSSSTSDASRRQTCVYSFKDGRTLPQGIVWMVTTTPYKWFYCFPHLLLPSTYLQQCKRSVTLAQCFKNLKMCAIYRRPPLQKFTCDTDCGYAQEWTAHAWAFNQGNKGAIYLLAILVLYFFFSGGASFKTGWGKIEGEQSCRQYQWTRNSSKVRGGNGVMGFSSGQIISLSTLRSYESCKPIKPSFKPVFKTPLRR